MRRWRRDLGSQAEKPEQRQVGRHHMRPVCQVESHALILNPVTWQGGLAHAHACRHVCICVGEEGVGYVSLSLHACDTCGLELRAIMKHLLIRTSCLQDDNSSRAL